MARLDKDVTPEYSLPRLHAWITSSCTLGPREMVWATERVVAEVMGVVSANALRAKPASPFSVGTLMRNSNPPRATIGP